jgi:hypothetical protein
VSDIEHRCSVIAPLATAYLEGGLTPGQQTSYETHLVFCDSCVAFLDDLRTISARLHALPTDRVDERMRRQIVEDAPP